METPSNRIASISQQSVYTMQEPSRKADAAALRLLAIRDRTVSEMRSHLERRFGAELAERTVTKLLSQGLLNDTDFAHHWRQNREKRKPRGLTMIKQELRQRGIAEDTIEAALENFDSADAAYRAVAKYASRQTALDKLSFDRRVGAFLGRRGFEPRIIRGTLRRLHTELDLQNEGQPSLPEP